MQSQLVCNGCRSVLLYPGGATNVCCALCNTVTPVPVTEMAQLVCAGCRTLLMYTRPATSVRCSCCSTVNLAPVPTQYAHVNCGSCRTMLMYPYGAPSVKCAVCHYVTNVGMANARLPIPMHRPNGTAYSGTTPSTSTSMPYSQSQTVVVENPRTIDESGKWVNNVVVGVTTDKKFFVVANAQASFHNLLILVLEIVGHKIDFKGLRLAIIAILDMLIVVLAAAGDGAAVFMAELGKNGNSHARWNKICDKFQTFCDHGSGALIASFIGLILLLIINIISIAKLFKPKSYNTI